MPAIDEKRNDYGCDGRRRRASSDQMKAIERKPVMKISNG